MAVITISNTGGNWSDSATWVGGLVPGATDDVVATATSGPLTVNTSSSCKSIVFTNYTNTFTINALLDVFGTFTLVPAMTIAGTNQLRFNTTATLTSAGKIIPWTLLWSGTSQTYTLGDNWNCSAAMSFGGTTALTINGNQIITTSTFNIGGTGVAGTTVLVMTGTGAIQGSGVVANSLTFNSPGGTITIGSATNVNLRYSTGTLTYTAGTIAYGSATGGLSVAGNCTLNTSGMTWQNIVFNATNTTTLTTDVNVSGSVTVSAGTTINGVGRVINVAGNYAINQAISGTAGVVMNGTGTWSTASGFWNAANLTFNTAGTITISGTVTHAAGTLAYVAGTISLGGSTLALRSTPSLDTNVLVWNAVTFTTTNTTTLVSDFYASGTVTTTNPTTINGAGKTFYMGSSLTQAGAITGTANIVLNGTGTWSGGNMTNNLTFNTVGTITITGSMSYSAGTMTYTAGTIITTGSTLNIGGNVTLNTSTLAWNNVSISNWITVTMSSNLTMLGNLTITPGAAPPVLNGSSILVGGNFTLNGSPGNLMTLIGSTTIVMTGTGTFTNPVNTLRIEVNFTINTTGTFTISGSLSFTSKTFTYINGTVDTTNGGLLLFGTGTTATLDTAGMKWASVFIFQLITVSLTSDLNVDTLGVGYFAPANSSTGANFATVSFGGVGKLNITTALNIGNGQWTLASNQDGSAVLNLPNPITVPALNIRLSAGRSAGFAYAAYNATINNHSVTVTDRITMLVTSIELPVTPSLTGTSEIIMKGNSWTIQGNTLTGDINTVGNNHGCGSTLTLDTPYLRFTSNIISYPNFIYNTSRTFKNLCPRVVTNVPLLLGTGPTMLNMNNIPWKKVTVTSGITVTMNQFFAGTASYKMLIVPSSTTNYNITFTDSFEKTTKFVEISNCTLTRPNQLIVLGDCRAKGTNSGIRYTNQSPNGLPKFLTKTNPSMTFDTGGLLPDPNFVKLK